MIFSKSFGYAIRGILYVAMKGTETRKIQLDEMAETLNVPRYFLEKVMKRVVKEGILQSVKGHNGGFSSTEKTLSTSLVSVAELMGDLAEFESCALRFRNCSSENPCPLHKDVGPIRKQFKIFLTKTTIQDLFDPNINESLTSIITG